MIQSLKKILFPIALLLAFGFVIVLINQISSLYLAIHTLSEVAGLSFLVLTGITLSSLLFLPLYHYYRMPAPIQHPASADELPAYHQRLVRRLSENQLLKKENKVPTSPTELPQAIAHLNQLADEQIRSTAKMIFLTTAISQNGKLDAFTVLGAQLRMVWKIAHVYYQRPTLRDLMRLYSYVGASSFLANEIEDLDISRQIEPVASALFKNASGKSVPIIGPAATLIMDSLLEGSTNAFLSLRVGLLTKKYCGSLEVYDSKRVKKEVLKEAGQHLKIISVQASGSIISALVHATKNAGLDTLKSGWEGVKKTGQSVGKGLSTLRPFTKKKETE